MIQSKRPRLINYWATWRGPHAHPGGVYSSSTANDPSAKTPERATIARPDGQPFDSEFAAKLAQARANAGDTHVVVGVDGGFVVQPKTDVANPENPGLTVVADDLKDSGAPAPEAGKPQEDNPFGSDVGQFGDRYRDAVDSVMKSKGGHATVSLPDVGDVSLVYGNDNYGLRHIQAKHGNSTLEKIPSLLKRGRVYSRPGVRDRVYVGSRDHEAVVRLDWDGAEGKWLVTGYQRSAPWNDLEALGETDSTAHLASRNGGQQTGSLPQRPTKTSVAPDGQAADSSPAAALPAPEPVPVTPEGQAITPQDAAQRAEAGLTPDVVQAQQKHPGFTPLSADEKAVAANATDIHPDDVNGDAVAVLVQHAEADPQSTQDLVNSNASDTALAARTAQEPTQQPVGEAGQRSPETSIPDEATSQPRQHQQPEGEAGSEIEPSQQLDVEKVAGRPVPGLDRATNEKPGSWMVIDRQTGKRVAELDNEKAVARLKKRFFAVPAGEYLGAYNKAVKESGGTEPPPDKLKKALLALDNETDSGNRSEFTTRADANKFLIKNKLAGSHAVVPVGDGFGVEPKARSEVSFSREADAEPVNPENAGHVPVVDTHKSFGGSLRRAKIWAYKHVRGAFNNARTHETYTVGRNAIDKMLSGKAAEKSPNAEVHADAVQALPEILKDGYVAEIRQPKEGSGNVAAIHRIYGAIRHDGKIYRVKVTAKAHRVEPNSAYSYEVQKVKVPAGHLETSPPDASPLAETPGAGRPARISIHNLLKGVRSDNGKLLLEDKDAAGGSIGDLDNFRSTRPADQAPLSNAKATPPRNVDQTAVTGNPEPRPRAGVSDSTGRKPLTKAEREQGMRKAGIEPYSVDHLQAAMSRALGRPVKVEKVAAPNDKALRTAAAIKRMFGRDVVFVRSDDKGMQGAHIGGNKLFVNADSRKPFEHVMGHELLHSIRTNDPELYTAVHDSLNHAINQDGANAFKDRLKDLYKRQGIDRLPEDKLDEEVMAEILGGQFSDPAFVRALQKTLEPSLFRRLAAHVTDYLEKAGQRIKGSRKAIGEQRYLLRQHADGARRTWQEALKEVNETARGDNGLDFQRVFHGGPHRDIEQHGFKLQKIGSGEGHQAYGWGIYFAKLRDVAESYRDSIKKNPMKIVERDGKYHLMILDSQLHPAEKITFDSREAAEAYFRANYPNQDGQLYHAEIPEDSDLLDWDKPLSEQPAGVRAKLEAIDKELPEHAHEELVENLNADWDELTGREMYKYLERLAAEGELPHQDELTADVGHPARAASEWLNGHGIPGLRYLDALSRQKWAIVEDGGAFYAENFGGQKREFATREDAATFATEQNAKESHNYVIWDEAHLNNDVTPYFSRSETPDDAEVGRIMRQYADHPKLPSKSDIAEAVRQYRQVESDNAESLRAHREGEPLPAPNGKPSNLNARNWVLTRTPNFRKWAGDWLSLQHRKFLDGDPVAAMRGDEVPANLGTMKAMIDWVSKDWETRYGGKAHNPSLGDVAVDRAAARDSAGHGMSKIKQKAFYLAPEIIEKGHVIGRLPKVANKPDAFVVAAPVRIGNAEYYGLVEVRRDANKQRMYVHEAVLRPQKTPEYDVQSAAASVETGKPHSVNSGAVATLLRHVLSVKPEDVTKVLDANGEPMAVYHGTNQALDLFDRGHTGLNTKAFSATEFFFTRDPGEASEYADLAAKNMIPDSTGHDRKVADLLHRSTEAERRGDFDESERLMEEAENLEYGAMQDDPSGAHVYPVFLSIRNPLRKNVGGMASTGEVGDIIKQAHDAGNDGVILENISDSPKMGGEPTTQYVAFHANQAKSASANIGTFDAGHDEIMFARGEAPDPFRPDPREADAYRENLRKTMGSLRTLVQPVKVTRTPAVLKALDVPDLPITITRDVVRKATDPASRDHVVPMQAIEQLPEELADPLLVFSGDKNFPSRVVLTELKDANGKPVIVALHLNQHEGRLQVNRIASVYGKDRARTIQSWIDGGRVLYQSERSPEQVRLIGLQLPQSGSLARGDSLKSPVLKGLQLPSSVSGDQGPNTVLRESDISSSGDVMFARGDDPTSHQPETTPLDEPFPITGKKLDNLRFHAQDKFIDLQRIQEGIESTGKKLDDTTNVKQGAELFTSKTAAQIEDFRKEVEEPLVKFLHESGLSVDEVGDWLTARHAAERNARMQEINPDVKIDGVDHTITMHGERGERFAKLLEKKVGQTYGLEVAVRAPTSAAECEGVTVARWKARVSVPQVNRAMAQGQAIHIEVADVPAYDVAPRPLRIDYPHLTSPFRSLLAPAESTREHAPHLRQTCAAL